MQTNLKPVAKTVGVLIVVELLLRWISGTPAPPAPYLIPDPVVGYRLRSGWAEQSGAIHINSNGFRGEGKKIPSDSILMIGIGGGDTFGRAVTGDNKAWPQRLEILYRKNLPERNIRVLNAGVPGHRLLYNLIDLEKRLLEMEPEFVLFMADIDHINLPPPPRAVPRWQRWSLLLGGIYSRLFPPSPPARQDHWPGEMTQTFRQHLISLIGICRVRNTRVVFSTIPNTYQVIKTAKDNKSSLEKFFKDLTPPAVVAAIRSYNEVIRRVAYQYEVYTVNSDERGKSSLSQELFLNDEGSLQVAQGFLNVTRKMGLYKKQQPTSIQRGSIL